MGEQFFFSYYLPICDKITQNNWGFLQDLLAFHCAFTADCGSYLLSPRCVPVVILDRFQQVPLINDSFEIYLLFFRFDSLPFMEKNVLPLSEKQYIPMQNFIISITYARKGQRPWLGLETFYISYCYRALEFKDIGIDNPMKVNKCQLSEAIHR